MNPTLKKSVVARAWRELLDPGSPAEDVDPAVTILRRARAEVEAHWSDVPLEAILEMAPDRMSRLAGLFDWEKPPVNRPALTGALHDAFTRCRIGDAEGASLLSLRRAHALFELLGRCDVVARALPVDVAWLFANDEHGEDLIRPLERWCVAQTTIGPAVKEAVRALRDEEPDSPILDRLAAWVDPGARGMHDLACWENAWRALDSEWRAAGERWERGERDAATDQAALAASIDPECSSNAWAVKRALDLDGESARRALHEALEAATEFPIVRVVLDAWIHTLGGES